MCFLQDMCFLIKQTFMFHFCDMDFEIDFFSRVHTHRERGREREGVVYMVTCFHFSLLMIL